MNYIFFSIIILYISVLILIYKILINNYNKYLLIIIPLMIVTIILLIYFYNFNICSINGNYYNILLNNNTKINIIYRITYF